MDELARKAAELSGRFNLGVRTEKLSSLSAMGTGGRALVVEAETLAELAELLKIHRLNDWPYLVVGGASNILFPDEDVSFSVLRLTGTFAALQSSGSEILAGAGCSTAKVLALSEKAGLSGLEMTAGLPGTLGGAVRGNAGSAAKGAAELASSLEMLDADGRALRLGPGDFQIGYRSLALPTELAGGIITSLRLSLIPSSPQKVKEDSSRVLAARRANQPRERSLGCVFKNPPGDSAGRLIDQCGLKGVKSGGAMISPKHANFIVNVGGASSRDVLALADRAADEVKVRFGHDLELEIKTANKRGLFIKRL